MPDLAQQIRARLDAPALVVEMPEREHWTVEQAETFRRKLVEYFGPSIRIVPLDPPSDTATPGQMRVALLAVLDLHVPIARSPQLVCGNCQTYGQNDLWPCGEIEAIAAALGVEDDDA